MTADNHKVYKVGETYIDKGGKQEPDDQLLRWLDSDEKTIANMGGIRVKSYTRLDRGDVQNMPSSLFLFTEKTDSTAVENPWKDMFDLVTGNIEYWGDAKFDPSGRKTEILNWNGNRHIHNIFSQIKKGLKNIIPPIFHFTKGNVGKVTFNGLFIINDLLTDVFQHKGHDIDNYRVKLKKLDTDEVHVNWINYRSSIDSLSELNNNNIISTIPLTWLDYIQET